ncbi:hypothetical protein BKA57DRAFT_439741 [Linnemannia elongata]|nr:hypothetical protein BKA57DRAFT_439741 [Linnemannia elongata]
MHFQSLFISLVVVLLTGTNLPTLVEGGTAYSDCISAYFADGVTASTEKYPAAQKCLEVSSGNITKDTLPMYTDESATIRRNHLVAAVQATFENLKECLNMSGLTQSDIDGIFAVLKAYESQAMDMTTGCHNKA